MGGFRPAPQSLAAGALLLLVVVAARGESAVPGEPVSWRPVERVPPPVTPGGPEPDVPGPMPVRPPSQSWLVDVVIGFVALVFVVAFVLFVHAMVRDIRTKRAGAGTGETGGGPGGAALLQDAVEQARDVLVRAGGQPRDAVIAAWVTLENATEHGRAPHQTATEFTVSLLEKETTDEEAVRELRTLYHRARFGRGGGVADAAAAKAALDRILATIR